MPKAPEFQQGPQIRFYTIDSSDAAQMVSMKDDARQLESALHLMPGTYSGNDEFGPVFEGYTGILDDHEVDLSSNGGHPVAEKFGDAEGDATMWFGFEGNEATKLARELRRIKITDADVENYFPGGDDSAETVSELHTWFTSTLSALNPEQLLLVRLVM